MNTSRDADAIISAFRPGWNTREKYDESLRKTHYNLDADAALEAYLLTLPTLPVGRPPIK